VGRKNYPFGPFAWPSPFFAQPTMPDRAGIPYSRGEIAELQKEVATAGIAPLAAFDQPLDHNSV